MTAAGVSLLLPRRSSLPSDRPVPDDAYVHDVDYVRATIESDGRAWLNTFAGPKRQDVVRRLCVDLSDMNGAPLSQADWDAFAGVVSAFDPSLDLATDLLCVEATLHTRDHSNGGHKMLDMIVGEEAYSGGKIALTELGSRRNSWEWRLIFDTHRGPVPGEGVCITHPTADTWTLATGCSAAGQAIDDVVQLWRLDDVFVHVADFNLAFRLELTTL